MVDRQARDEMASVLRSYMGEKMTAFALDDALASVAGRTQDRSVQEMAHALWYHYDDCRDHRIVATKEQWDYFHRILLLLESDAEVETVRARRDWHLSQAAAAGLFIAFGVIAFRVGFGVHLLGYALPFGPPSMLLAWQNRRRRRAIHALERILTPFPSMASMLFIRRRVRSFAKRRYPASSSTRSVHGSLLDKAMIVPLLMLWCVVSPVVLFVQMLPGSTSREIVRVPERT